MRNIALGSLLLAFTLAGAPSVQASPNASASASRGETPAPAVNGPDDSASVEAAEMLEGDSNISAADIETALTAAGATNVNVRPFTEEEETSGPDVRARALPQDLFSVTATWADWWENGKKHVALYGRWNYRDDVVGSGAPADIAALAVSGFPTSCWRNAATGLTTQSSDGTHTNLGWLQDSGHQKSVFGVNDRTSGFRLLTDMGFSWIDMKRVGDPCGGTKSGTFHHEHNQDGHGGWSASVGVGALSVSYSGSPGQYLRRGTPVIYY